ncbi:MAG: sulfatase-like hydrolase/transferase [Bacteroidales bacterium]|nr:sulfatase-like hydrolase/transferase [Bacteroidales bacterium]MCF8390022.1 sulfatase-like hydrolase/transferase [Bacteroidales bacterium]
MKMTFSRTKFLISISTSGLFLAGTSCIQPEKSLELPNILWITSEDNSPFLGCYGDSFATTPNLDMLASEGYLYTHAYANAPVCAPARNTIITGVYANSGGNQNMRSQYPHSESVVMYPEFLKSIGYFCTNNSKTDYNTNFSDSLWNELGTSAHYKNRKNDQPFFAVFNSTISHESSIHKYTPTENLIHVPSEVKLPPYHPDTPEMRHDWAQYYDKITEMDAWVGNIIKDLEESGEAENTIIFYYGDHGGVLGRSKRFVYESGTRVPFIVSIPEKYKHLRPAKKVGTKIDRIISFVDLAPTLLSITGIDIPEFMQGSAFLGNQKTEDPDYAYMFRGRMDERIDMVRAVRDKKFRYIRNYLPYRIYGQHIEYLWRAPNVGSWEKAFLNGECNEIQSRFWNTKPVEELYDTENDPWEVNNLAGNPDYTEVLERMRKANNNWILEIKDAGFFPESEIGRISETEAMYDYMRSGKVNLEKIVEAAEISTMARAEDLELLLGYTDDENTAIRYWGVTGLLILGENARQAMPELKALLSDPSGDVVCLASEALYNLGEKDLARKGLISVLSNKNEFARVTALNTIDFIGDDSKEIKDAVLDVLKNYSDANRNSYDIRMTWWLMEKWGIKQD